MPIDLDLYIAPPIDLEITIAKPIFIWFSNIDPVSWEHQRRCAQFNAIGNSKFLSVGDETALFWIHQELDNYRLIRAEICVGVPGSSQNTIFRVRNKTTGNLITSTNITVEPGESCSFTATVPCVIDDNYNVVSAGDCLAIDTLQIGTGVKGMSILLTFENFVP